MKTNQKTGFTLIELLVVISIIGMLMGLLLPAINGAREQGRRIQCQNNQRNIALAIISYDSQKKELPPMRQSHPTDVGAEMNWFMLIMPFIEENALYRKITANPPTILEGEIEKIAVLACPTSSKGAQRGQTSYVVNCGPLNVGNDGVVYSWGDDGYMDFGDRNTALFLDRKGGSYDSTGKIFQRRTESMSIDYVSGADGASKTLLLAENEDAGNWCYFDTNGKIQSGDERDIGFAIPLFWTGTEVKTQLSLGATRALVTDTGWPVTNLTGNVISPNWINEGRGAKDSSAWHKFVRPSAFHSGVVIGVACDGAVHTINDSIASHIYARLCMPNDEQTVSFP